MTTTGSPRRQDLDLMRAAVVGGLIFFHTARIFNPLDFYVKDHPPNLPLTLLPHAGVGQHRWGRIKARFSSSSRAVSAET